MTGLRHRCGYSGKLACRERREDGAELGGGGNFRRASRPLPDGAEIAAGTKRAAPRRGRRRCGRIIGDAEKGFVESCAEFMLNRVSDVGAFIRE